MEEASLRLEPSSAVVCDSHVIIKSPLPRGVSWTGHDWRGTLFPGVSKYLERPLKALVSQFAAVQTAWHSESFCFLFLCDLGHVLAFLTLRFSAGKIGQ